jgi:YVTN family beta-propeller protein
VTATIPVGGNPNGVAVNSKTNTIFVTGIGDGTVSVISGQTNTVTATIPVGDFPSFPRGVTVNPKTNTAYVATSGNDTVSVLTCG